MTDERFDELVQRVLDDELAGPDVAELAAEVRARPARRLELQQHLAVWELWTQQQAPERSAEAFLAACRTRLAADRGSAEFVSAVTARVRRRESPLAQLRAGVADAWHRLASGWRAPVAMGWTAACALLVAAFIWFEASRPLQAMTVVRGEAVCTACTLHQGHDHTPAIRVHGTAGDEIYYVVSDRRPVLRLGDYCRAPVPLVAHGATDRRAGRHVIDIRTVDADRASRPAPPADHGPVLFPF